MCCLSLAQKLKRCWVGPCALRPTGLLCAECATPCYIIRVFGSSQHYKRINILSIPQHDVHGFSRHQRPRATQQSTRISVCHAELSFLQFKHCVGSAVNVLRLRGEWEEPNKLLSSTDEPWHRRCAARVWRMTEKTYSERALMVIQSTERTIRTTNLHRGHEFFHISQRENIMRTHPSISRIMAQSAERARIV